jgi:mRNA-degrading endonuclease toxin of MazEF toxin-antitoxin module
MKTKPGEVWLADLGLAAKTRPVLIVSREDNDPPRSLIIYVPITTKSRGKESPLAFRTFSRRTATSSSRLSVVLMHQNIEQMMP